VDAHAQPTLGEPERRRTPRNAGADDRDIDPAVVPGARAGQCGIFEPKRIQEVGR
jgi:hypothetical protein